MARTDQPGARQVRVFSIDKQASANRRPIKTGSPKNMVIQLQLSAEMVLQLLEMVLVGS